MGTRTRWSIRRQRPPPVWWDAAYSYKRNLVILNNDSHGVGSHYPVHLHFDSTTTPTAEEIYNASQAAVKGNDVRVVGFG